MITPQIIKFESYVDADTQQNILACWVGGMRLHTPLLQQPRSNTNPATLMETILQSPEMTATLFFGNKDTQVPASREAVVQQYLPVLQGLREAFSEELFNQSKLLDVDVVTARIYTYPLGMGEVEPDLAQGSYLLEAPVRFEPPKRTFEPEPAAVSQKKSTFKLKY